MRNTKLAMLLLLGAFGEAAYSDGFEGEVGYLRLDTGQFDITLGSAYGIVGYTWEGGGSYAGTLEFMGALGMTDDSFEALGLRVELDSILGIGYKGTMDINPDLSGYLRALYVRIDTSESGPGVGHPGGIGSRGGLLDGGSASDFGLGVGLTYRNFTVGFLEFTGDLDSIHALTLGYHF